MRSACRSRKKSSRTRHSRKFGQHLLRSSPESQCLFSRQKLFNNFLFDSTCQSGIFQVRKKNLLLRLILETRRSNQHFRVHPKFQRATGDSFSRVELLIGKAVGGEAPVLHLVMFRMDSSLGYSRMAATLFLLATFDSSRFRHDGEERQEVSCLRGAKVVSCATHVAHDFFLEHVLLPPCRPSSSELCGSACEFHSVVGPNHSVGFRLSHADNFGAFSKCATLTDGCLDGLCDSSRRAGPHARGNSRCSFRSG